MKVEIQFTDKAVERVLASILTPFLAALLCPDAPTADVQAVANALGIDADVLSTMIAALGPGSGVVDAPALLFGGSAGDPSVPAIVDRIILGNVGDPGNATVPVPTTLDEVYQPGIFFGNGTPIVPITINVPNPVFTDPRSSIPPFLSTALPAPLCATLSCTILIFLVREDQATLSAGVSTSTPDAAVVAVQISGVLTTTLDAAGANLTVALSPAASRLPAVGLPAPPLVSFSFRPSTERIPAFTPVSASLVSMVDPDAAMLIASVMSTISSALTTGFTFPLTTLIPGGVGGFIAGSRFAPLIFWNVGVQTLPTDPRPGGTSLLLAPPVPLYVVTLTLQIDAPPKAPALAAPTVSEWTTFYAAPPFPGAGSRFVWMPTPDGYVITHPCVIYVDKDLVVGVLKENLGSFFDPSRVSGSFGEITYSLDPTFVPQVTWNAGSFDPTRSALAPILYTIPRDDIAAQEVPRLEVALHGNLAIPSCFVTAGLGVLAKVWLAVIPPARLGVFVNIGASIDGGALAGCALFSTFVPGGLADLELDITSGGGPGDEGVADILGWGTMSLALASIQMSVVAALAVGTVSFGITGNVFSDTGVSFMEGGVGGLGGAITEMILESDVFLDGSPQQAQIYDSNATSNLAALIGLTPQYSSVGYDATGAVDGWGVFYDVAVASAAEGTATATLRDPAWIVVNPCEDADVRATLDVVFAGLRTIEVDGIATTLPGPIGVDCVSWIPIDGISPFTVDVEVIDEIAGDSTVGVRFSMSLAEWTNADRPYSYDDIVPGFWPAIIRTTCGSFVLSRADVALLLSLSDGDIPDYRLTCALTADRRMPGRSSPGDPNEIFEAPLLVDLMGSASIDEGDADSAFWLHGLADIASLAARGPMTQTGEKFSISGTTVGLKAGTTFSHVGADGRVIATLSVE